jgi:hypothetical protein
MPLSGTAAPRCTLKVSIRASLAFGKLYVEMSFNLARDATGGVIGSFAVARDVTSRHAEKMVR